MNIRMWLQSDQKYNNFLLLNIYNDDNLGAVIFMFSWGFFSLQTLNANAAANDYDEESFACHP